jgi:hypothetical protein
MVSPMCTFWWLVLLRWSHSSVAHVHLFELRFSSDTLMIFSQGKLKIIVYKYTLQGTILQSISHSTCYKSLCRNHTQCNFLNYISRDFKTLTDVNLNVSLILRAQDPWLDKKKKVFFNVKKNNEWVQQSFIRNNVSARFIKHMYHNMFRLKSKPSSGVIVYRILNASYY